MSHDHEAPTGSAATANAELPDAPEPAFLARAGRILSGDVRPDDYLPVPSEVQAEIDREYAATGEYADHRQRTLNAWVLSYLYGGTGPVMCRETEQGVLVLAVGLEHGRQLLNHFPRPEQRPGFAFTTPFLWQTPRPKN